MCLLSPFGVLPFFFDFPCDNSGVLRLRSDSKYNKGFSYKLLTNKSHVLGVAVIFGVPLSKIFPWGYPSVKEGCRSIISEQ